MRVDTGDILSSIPIAGSPRFLWSPDHWVILVNKVGVVDGFVPSGTP